MSASEDTFTVLCQLLEPFNTAKIALKPETDISADLNIDSVSVMDFVMPATASRNAPNNAITTLRCATEIARLTIECFIFPPESLKRRLRLRH